MEEEQPQSLPTELDRWLDDRAAETGRERGEVLARAVATHRLLTDAADATDVPPLEQQLAELADRVDDLETETDDQIEDVRDRVIQVARSRAESDHDHPDLEARIDEVERDEGDEIATLRRVLASLERRVDGGFDNYEAVLSSLTDRTDDTERKLDMLASAIVDLRKRVTELEAAGYRRASGGRQPGTWAREGDRVRLTTRAFPFPDGREPSRALRLRFRGGRIQALQSASDGGAVATDPGGRSPAAVWAVDVERRYLRLAFP